MLERAAPRIPTGARQCPRWRSIAVHLQDDRSLVRTWEDVHRGTSVAPERARARHTQGSGHDTAGQPYLPFLYPPRALEWLARRVIKMSQRRLPLQFHIGLRPLYGPMVTSNYSTRASHVSHATEQEVLENPRPTDIPLEVHEPSTEANDPMTTWQRLSQLRPDDPQMSLASRPKYLAKLWNAFELIDCTGKRAIDTRKSMFLLSARFPHPDYDRRALQLLIDIPRQQRDTDILDAAVVILKRALSKGLPWNDRLVAKVYQEAIYWGQEIEKRQTIDEQTVLAIKKERGLAANTETSPQQSQDQVTDQQNNSEKPFRGRPSFEDLREIWEAFAAVNKVASPLRRFGISLLTLCTNQCKPVPSMSHATKISFWRLRMVVDTSQFGEMCNLLLSRSDGPSELLQEVLFVWLKSTQPKEVELKHAMTEKLAGPLLSNPSASIRDEVLTLLTNHSTMMILNQENYDHDSEATSLSNLHRVWSSQQASMPVKLYGNMLEALARTGREGAFKKWMDQFMKEYTDWKTIEEHLWLKVYLHARRADSPSAEAAFVEIDEVSKKHGGRPLLRVWNSLILAYCRSNDLQSALWTLKRMQDANVVPDAHGIHPILEALAKRGLHARVREMIEDFNKSHTWGEGLPLHTSLILAYIRANDMEKAVSHLRWLQSMVGRHGRRELLTHHYNRILTEYAIRREMTQFSETLQTMRYHRVLVDAAAYESVLLVLTLHRQTDYAWSILQHSLPAAIHPTSRHFAIVMQGFIREGRAAEACHVEEYMRARNIPRDHEVRRLLLQAKVRRTVDQESPEQTSESADQTPPIDGSKQATTKSAAVERALQLLREIEGEDARQKLALSSGSSTLSKGDNLALAVPDDFFQQLLATYSSAGMMDVVEELVKKIAEERKHSLWDSQDMSMGLLAALMRAYGRLGNFDKARVCWARVLEQALDDKTRNSGYGRSSSDARSASLLDKKRPHRAKNLLHVGKPFPGRRTILARPLGAYIEVLAKQKQFNSILQLVLHARSLTYALDNNTWNLAIRSLCQHDPPYARLAFELCEEALVGDAQSSGDMPQESRQPKKRAGSRLSLLNTPGLAQLRNYTASPWQLRPLPNTLRSLADALAALKWADSRSKDALPVLRKRHVGDATEIEAQSPETVRLVLQQGQSEQREERGNAKSRPIEHSDRNDPVASEPNDTSMPLRNRMRGQGKASRRQPDSPEQMLSSSGVGRRIGAVNRALYNARMGINERRDERRLEVTRKAEAKKLNSSDAEITKLRAALQAPQWPSARRVGLSARQRGPGATAAPPLPTAGVTERPSDRGRDWLQQARTRRVPKDRGRNGAVDSSEAEAPAVRTKPDVSVVEHRK